MDAPMVEENTFPLFAELPQEMQAAVFKAATIQKTKQKRNIKTAIRFLKERATVNRLYKNKINSESPQLICHLSQKFHLPEFPIAYALDQLAEKWFQKNLWFMQNKDRYNQLRGCKTVDETIESLKKEKADLMAHHGYEIIDYLAHKFYVSSYKIAFDLGGLAEQWFRKKGLLKEEQVFNQTLLQKLEKKWKFEAACLSYLAHMNHHGLEPEQKVKKCLEMGADPNTCSACPLVLASTKGTENQTIVKLLLRHGANPNIQGGRALMAAVNSGLLEIVKILLEHNANPTLKNKEGKTALKIAKEKEHRDEIVKILQEAMAKWQEK